jgi:hypothetical protein
MGQRVGAGTWARACLRESRELSAAVGYQSGRDLVWAAGYVLSEDDRALARPGTEFAARSA